jgi:hypothetical protein
MRLAGAILSSLVVAGLMTLASAEPAKQADPKDKGKAPATKTDAKKDAKKETKQETKKETKKDAKKDAKTDAKKKSDPAAASYAAIPLAERIAIQNDLVWTGDYNGSVTGEFGDRAIAAVKAFQKRHGAKETGVLNPQERATLAAAAKPKQDAVGWRIVDDPATGARIGIPAKLVPQQSQIIGGTRWASARGEYAVETFRIAQPGATLASVFERMKKEPAGRKADYSVLRGDFFVISGLQNLKKFYVRAQLRGEEIRGFTVSYDQAMSGIMEPVAVAMSSAFAGFPGAGAAPPPRRKVEYASGVMVAPGLIATSRDALDGCYVTTVAGIGGVDRVAEDKERGLVLLRVYASEMKPIALAADAAKGDVTLVGVPDPQAQGGGSAVATAKARVTDALGIEPVPALGYDGAAVIDAQGRLAGLAALKVPLVAGSGQTSSAALTPVDTVRKLVADAKAESGETVTGVDAAKRAVVRVICVRK